MKLKFALFLGVFSLVSCKKNDPKDVEMPGHVAVVRINPQFGSETLELDHTYSLNDSTDIQIVELKFYLSDITSEGVQKKDYSLFDYRARQNVLYTFSGTPDNFITFDALVGVPESVNHSDPAGFPTSSMLNINNASDMYWGWSGGFIFLKIEAKADTIPDGIANFDHNLIYHVATDGFAGNISLPANWVIYPHNSFLDFHLNVEQIFNNPTNRIEVRDEFQTPHMPAPEGSLTEKVMDNFIDAFSL